MRFTRLLGLLFALLAFCGSAQALDLDPDSREEAVVESPPEPIATPEPAGPPQAPPIPVALNGTEIFMLRLSAGDGLGFDFGFVGIRYHYLMVNLIRFGANVGLTTLVIGVHAGSELGVRLPFGEGRREEFRILSGAFFVSI